MNSYNERDDIIGTTKEGDRDMGDIVADITTSFVVLVGIFFPSVTGITLSMLSNYQCIKVLKSADMTTGLRRGGGVDGRARVTDARVFNDQGACLVIITIIVIIIKFVKHQCAEGLQWHWQTVAIVRANLE